jgi:hypothetical protein
MKTTIHKFILAVVMFSMVLASCTKDFTDTNTDPNNTPSSQPHQLLAPALVGIMGYNQLRNRNFNNELMQVTVNRNDGEGTVFRYDYRSNWSDNLYNGWYLEMTNLKDMHRIASDTATLNKSYQAISLILQSWVYSMLTDTYGDVPYFQSNQAKDTLRFEPAFDTQKDIYTDIFKKLEEANTLLGSSPPAIVASSDPVYNGDVAKWRRFGNSLYLRLLLRISGKAEVAAATIAKIKEIVDTKASTYPKISKNDESAILRWTGAGPYVSPFITVREQDFRAPSLGSFFIETLGKWNDPRINIPVYGTGTPTKTNRWGIAPSQGNFIGVPSGYLPGQDPGQKAYFYSNTNNSGAGPSLMNDPMTGMIMNFAEVNLMYAEAAVKGWINGTAKTFYENGADASIKLWLPNWPDTSTKIYNIQDQLAAADIDWDDTYTEDQKMELIHLQKYYALFLVDLQQWFEYRRTGHPNLPKGPGLKNNGVMPARMTYPVYVQSTNPTNYKIAVANQGPDAISTQVWWQKP